MFNSYYNHLGDRISRGNRHAISRPELSKIWDYRQYIEHHITNKIENFSKEELETLLLGINHEEQHQELMLMDIKFNFWNNPFPPQYTQDKRYEFLSKDIPNDQTKITIKEGAYLIGYDKEEFCFDNELPRHKIFLNEFQLENRLITNREWLDFIKQGGYSKNTLWQDDGWKWAKDHQIKAPLYWKESKEGWQRFTLNGLVPLDLETPVSHISYYEAWAFANWASMRLPTEAEWEIASQQIHWGFRWEWTSSHYQAYPGYRIKDNALGEYNGKFMINQIVLKGAASITPQGHSRASYRNFYHPDSRWSFTGLRLAHY